MMDEMQQRNILASYAPTTELAALIRSGTARDEEIPVWMALNAMRRAYDDGREAQKRYETAIPSS